MADALEPPLPPPPPPKCGGGESGRSSPSPTASPEFEFWMVGRNPSPALLTADELFSGGVVLPLHNLQASSSSSSSPTDDGDGGAEEGEEGPADHSSAAATAQQQPLLAESSSSIAPTPDLPAVTFKWKDIFRGPAGGEPKDKDQPQQRKKTEKKTGERRVSSVSGNSAELININIWPFSRSRSAGHSHSAAAGSSVSLSGSRAKPNSGASASGNGAASNNGSVTTRGAPAATCAAAPAPTAARKVSSAPCSRSNSRGESGPEPTTAVRAAIPAAAAAAEAAAAAGGHAAPLPGPTSMLRRLVPGHGRTNAGGGGGGGSAATGGIRLGRPSPVWQLRRNKLQQTAAEQKQKKKAPPISTTSCDDDDKAAAAAAVAAPAGCRNNAGCSEAGGRVEEGANGAPQGLFGLRTFFSKKVY